MKPPAFLAAMLALAAAYSLIALLLLPADVPPEDPPMGRIAATQR